MPPMRLALALVFLFCAVSVQAFQLSGTVTGSDGRVVPYASVFVKNTTYGVATNLKGQYFLELSAGDYVIVVQAVGYDAKEEPVAVSGNQTLNVRLNIRTQELEEVTVKAKRKDPAYGIMKKAVENRKRYMHPVSAYTCSTYVKADMQTEFMRKDTMSRAQRKLDTLPDFLTREQLNFYESYGLTHWRSPNQLKEVKMAVNDFYDRSYHTVSVSFSGEGESSYLTNGTCLLYTSDAADD